MSQQFCLKWNNHMNNMMDVFQNLLSTESMVDVTLACDGLSLKAHKMVLSACSPFFQALFLENPCQHPIVILKDMKYTELKAIIEFMYHGEVNVAQDQLSALMKTAETLRVKGLAEVTNEKNQSTPQENTRQSHSDAPSPHSKRRKVRNRKRSISGSDYSDSESQPQPKIKQPASPDIEELSGGDISMDASSGQFSNVRQSRVPMQSHQTHSSNSYHKTSSVASSQDLHMEAGGSENESDFGAEPAKLLQQSLTTEDARRSNRLSTMSTSSEPQRRPKSSTDHSMGMSIVPTSLPSDDNSQQQPLSPPDIKPELLELDPPMSPVAGTSHSTENAMVVYGDPGPSTYQDNSALVPQDSQQQGNLRFDTRRSQQTFQQPQQQPQSQATPPELLAFLSRPGLTITESSGQTKNYNEPKKSQPQRNLEIRGKDGRTIDPSALKVYHCEFCPFETHSTAAYGNHLNEHSASQALQCRFCQKIFKNSSTLQAHMHTHDPNRVFTCMYCEKKFKHQSSLRTHMKIHYTATNEQQQQQQQQQQQNLSKCPICDKSFTSETLFKKHMIIHQLS